MGTVAAHPLDKFKHDVKQPIGTYGFHKALPVTIEGIIFRSFGMSDILCRVARLSRYFALRVKNLQSTLTYNQNWFDDDYISHRELAFKSLGIIYPTYYPFDGVMVRSQAERLAISSSTRRFKWMIVKHIPKRTGIVQKCRASAETVMIRPDTKITLDNRRIRCLVFDKYGIEFYDLQQFPNDLIWSYEWINCTNGFIPTLTQHASAFQNLRVLELKVADHERMDIVTGPISSTVQFLNLENCGPNIDAWAIAFPNVQELNIHFDATLNVLATIDLETAFKNWTGLRRVFITLAFESTEQDDEQSHLHLPIHRFRIDYPNIDWTFIIYTRKYFTNAPIFAPLSTAFDTWSQHNGIRLYHFLHVPISTTMNAIPNVQHIHVTDYNYPALSSIHIVKELDFVHTHWPVHERCYGMVKVLQSRPSTHITSFPDDWRKRLGLHSFHT